MKLNISPEKMAQLRALFAELEIREEDLIERFIRASGPGGQKVNKTSSAVYLKHVPTGTEVKVQTARSQSLNRFNARRLLAKRLLNERMGEQSEEAARVAKVRRQKRKRSKRAKNKMLQDKAAVSQKKQGRSKPTRDD